jgi:hypothetical protein
VSTLLSRKIGRSFIFIEILKNIALQSFFRPQC